MTAHMPQTIADTLTLNNGVAMPRLGLGTWRSPEGDEVAHAVRDALQMGYRLIDTAAAYGNESGVGRGLFDSGVPRDEVFVTTKLWNAVRGHEETLRAFDESLTRLGVETLDLYLIHWPCGDSFLRSWPAMEQLVRDGRCRAIGVSNFQISHLQTLLANCEIPPAVNQIEYHPHLQQPELHAFCHQHNIAVEAWSPLMQGKITDLPDIAAIAANHDKTPAQVALRWQLQRGAITIPKSVHARRLQENADLFDFHLTDIEMQTIDVLDQGRRIGPDPQVVKTEA